MNRHLRNQDLIEPVYNVFNQTGTLLLTAVSHAHACELVDEYQQHPDAAPEWQGDIAIRVCRQASLNSSDVIRGQQ